MHLERCASVVQGAFLSRIAKPSTHCGVKLQVFTVKEMNEWLSPASTFSEQHENEIYVAEDRIKTLPLTREGLVLVSLNSPRAIAIKKEHGKKLIPSNFAIIEPTSVIDPDYLEWFINEHPQSLRYMKVATQGSIVGALSIQMLRTLEIVLPPMNEQLKIGNINRLLHRKNRLVMERMKWEHQYFKQKLIINLKEGQKT